MDHDDAIELLPRYVTGSLEADERAAVAAHVDGCAVCREAMRDIELAHRSVAEVGIEEPAPRAVQTDDTSARVDSIEEQRKRAARAAPGGLAAVVHWLAHGIGWDATPIFARVALVAQLALLIAVGTVALRHQPVQQRFEAVSSAAVAAGGPRLSVAFRDSATVAQVQTLLGELDSQVVAGPTALGLFTIVIGPRTNVDQVARQLQASGLATFVAPVAR